MKPILYPAGETQFKNNGLGRLSEATKCLVTEERNGQYELEMQYPVTGRHYKEIIEERIIAARHDDSDDVQPFRIYKITRPMNGIVTVSARHISYQLSKVAVMPFSAETCAGALGGMITNSVGDCPFSFWTDKLLEAHFSVDVPSSFRSLLGGLSGSILDVYGPGEYEWDKFTVKFHTHRGADQNVMIRYGKNMTDVKKTTDTSNIWTGILPYWAGTDESEQAILVTLPEKVIYSAYAGDYVYKMVVPVDLSSSFQEQPTVEQLRSRAQSYVAANAADGIPASIDVSFVALWQTEEYKNWAPLQKLKLCDTVTVYHKGLGIENKAKIVAVTYNVILERYEKMTIGEVKTNLGDSIRQISEEIKKEVPTNASVSQAISLATNILSGSMGGNIMINTNAQGQPVEIIERWNLTQYDVKEASGQKQKASVIRIADRTIHDITKENLSEVPRSRGSNQIEFIVVHYLGVPNADNPNLYGGGYGGHYNIKRDGSIYKAADPKTAVVWHCGGGLQGSGGHSFYQICTNFNSIGIECGVCYTDTSVKDASGDSDQWYFTTETQESLVWLVSKLMDEYGISADHVIRHYDVTGKICPNPYVKNNKLRTSWTWEEFKSRLAEYRQSGGYATEGSAAAPVASDAWYRVRKSWGDAASQVGAFKVLDNAKTCADEHPGYYVFDPDGKKVYTPKASVAVPFLVRVKIRDLNIRTGPGTDHAKTGQYTGIGVFTIVEVADGKGSDAGWGRLKSGAGWCSLDYCQKI